MSAGNVILYTNSFAASTFPSTTTVLSSGNYWIEEVDFILSYASASGTVFSNALFFLQTSPGGSTLWLQDFALNFPAASTVVFNIPVVSRPRIFVTRTNSITFTITNIVAGTTLIVCSLNIYGRQLP